MVQAEDGASKPRCDFPPGIPFASHSEDWSGPDPSLPQETDIMRHESEKPRDDQRYDEWQVQLRAAYVREMGNNLDCTCARSHYNLTHGMWICVHCRGDMEWRHSEPPCVHSGDDNVLCTDCSVQASLDAVSFGTMS